MIPVEPLLGDLSYICIYNPTLDPAEKSLSDQIVFFYGGQNDKTNPVPIQTQLRYIGLAQGVIEFSKYVYFIWPACLCWLFSLKCIANIN